MGKVKSAIITTILVAAIIVLAFFTLFSWQVPGSQGVDRYNSFLSNVHLGGNFTGEASAVLYPDGVITSAEFEIGKPVQSEDETADEYKDRLDKYTDKYEPVGNLYFDKEIIEDKEALKADVLSDAQVISGRYSEKGYSGYSVSVQDGYTLKVTVPTNFTYAAYKEYDSTSRTDATAKIERSIAALAYDGELSLRNSEVGTAVYDNILTPISVDVNDYFTGFSSYSAGGNHAVRVNLTKEGREMLKTVSNTVYSNAENDKTIGFYIGENQLLSLTIDGQIDSGSFYIQSEEAYAQDYAIVLDSVINGETVKLNYNSAQAEVLYASSALGELSMLLLGIAVLVIILAAIIYSVVRYKKLGLVNLLMILVFALAIVIALMLLEIQLTVAGAITAVLGLALMCGSNFAVFEAVRKQTKTGKTIQASVKSGYKSIFTGILDLHVVLAIASLIATLIGVGELAACGFIFFIATVASYLLYWFTRFMWYVLSSPVKNKFGFCGFAREELSDD